MKITSIIITSIACLSSLNGIILPTAASWMFTQNTPDCQQAIASVLASLEAVEQTEVALAEAKEHGYEQYPEGRYLNYNIGITGQGAEVILTNAPIFLTRIGAEILKNCPSIGMVSIGMYQTDWQAIIGIFWDGQIKAFECVSSNLTYEPATDQLEWGYTLCG